MKRANFQNELKLSFPSLSLNEGLARSAVAVFIAQLNPTIEELADIKCAVSEAVTNAIVHGYRDTCGTVYITMKYTSDRLLQIDIRDRGCGIPDVKAAMEPLFTTDTSGERSGMGFAVMESFTDRVRVRSVPGKGTTVTLQKRLSPLPRMRI